MTVNNKLIKEINVFLESENQSNSAEIKVLAEKYAQASKALKTRIQSCVDLLKDAKASEAAEESNAKPDIWTVAKGLKLSDFKAWLDLCDFYDWDTPDEINSSALDFIKQELLTMEQELVPMLNYYRAKIRNMSVSEKVTILRKIKQLDPKNEQWGKDLQALEAEYINDLKKRAKKAIQNHKLEDLENIYTELNNQKFKAKVGKKVFDGCKRKIQEFGGEKLKDKGNRVLLKIDNAYAMQEREELAKELQCWQDEVENNEYFEFAKIDIERLHDPTKWLADENKKIETEQNYQKAIVDLSAAMDNNETMEVLETLFFNLGSFDESVPYELNMRYQALSENYTIQQARRSRNIVIISVVVLFFSVITVWWVIVHYQHLNKRERNVKHISSLLQSKSIKDAASAFKKLKRYDRSIYQSPEIKTLLHKFIQLKEQEKMRLMDLEKYFNILENIVSNNFNDEEKYKRTMQATTPLIMSSQDQIRINVIKDAYNQYLTDKRETDTCKFTIRVDEILGALSDFETIYLQQKEYDFNTKIDFIMSQIDNLSEMNTDKEIKQKSLKLITNKIKKLKKNYQNSLIYRQKVLAFTKKLKKIIKKNKMLLFYEKLKEFVNTSGGRDHNSVYAQLLKNYTIAENLTALARYNTKSLSGIKAIWQEIDEIGKNENPWYIPAKQLYEAVPIMSQSNVSEILQNKKFEFMKLYQNKFYNKKGQVYCYYGKTKRSRIVIMSKTDVYAEVEKYGEVVFKKTKGVWSIPTSSNREFKIHGFSLDKSVYPAAIECWNELKAAIMFTDIFNVEDIFITWLEKTVNNFEINPAFKCEMLSLVLALMDRFAKKQPELLEYTRGIEKVHSIILKNGLIYSNLPPDQFRALNIMIKDIPLERLRIEVDQRTSVNLILKDMLNMQLSWAGLIIPTDGRPEVMLSSKVLLRREIWMLTIKKDSSVQFNLIGVNQEGNFISSVPRTELRPGSYLFSPKVGIDTKKLATDIKHKFNSIHILWPELWPINCR